jgi:molecular chaperone GrpE (heat shock protein)
MMQSSDSSSSIATILQEFMPVLDQLTTLRNKYGVDDEFGKQYNAIRGDFMSALRDLGVTEFTIAVGDMVDYRKVRVIESRYDDVMPINTIIEVVHDHGMELAGNIVRKAEAIVSLGPKVPDPVEGEESK